MQTHLPLFTHTYTHNHFMTILLRWWCRKETFGNCGIVYSPGTSPIAPTNCQSTSAKDRLFHTFLILYKCPIYQENVLWDGTYTSMQHIDWFKWLLFAGAVIRNVGVKPTVFMTASEAVVTSVTASAATSAATMKPYVVAAVVDPSEV